MVPKTSRPVFRQVRLQPTIQDTLEDFGTLQCSFLQSVLVLIDVDSIQTNDASDCSTLDKEVISQSNAEARLGVFTSLLFAAGVPIFIGCARHQDSR